jgi:signal transduction histidine kinase
MTALPPDVVADLRQENARLQAELNAAQDRQNASAEILRAIANAGGDAGRSLQRIAEITASLFGASSVSLLIADGERWGQTFRVGAGSERIASAIPLAHVAITTQFMPGAVYLENRQVHVPDCEDPAAMARWPGLTPARAAGTRTMSGTPLRREERAIGALIVHRDRLEPFTEDELALQQSFADQAVIAIENARLFNETREALERQTATADILKVIASSPSDVQPVFEAIATSANRLVGGFSSTVFRLIDGIAHLKAFTPTTPAADKVLQETFPRPAVDFPPFRMAQAGEVTRIPDTDALSDAIGDIARARGFRSMLFAPLMNDGVSIGLIAVTRVQPSNFTDHHVQLLQTFADQAVIAIENVRLFEEVQARTRELSQSLDDLRTAQDRLVQTEKLASLGQLTAGIAHEIKNPLNFVNNFAALSAELTDELNEVLKPATLAGDIREEVDELTGLLKDNLQKVVQHGKRADSIVKNMLLHSREGSGEHRPADINALLDESLNLAYHGARAEKPQFNVTLQRDFDELAGLVELFPQEITRVFLNLISNGFYAVSKRKTENGGTDFEPLLFAATRNLGDTVEIRIRDNGTGIPAEVKEKMFNPFFTTKPAGEGTGLGLSMSHDIIVKQHGGRIEVETEPGQFTEFRIVLPRTSGIANKDRGQP